ncbi:MAG: hypothetical protein JXA16_01040 [Bacteroidales bacterium]|nr:hypothetical protein [Bacteroidales bacterium]
MGLPYPLGNLSLPDITGGLQNIGSALVGKSLLGRTIYMPIVIDNQWLPNTFINISAQKRIVKTAISGRNGTVKEIISTEDYQIKIRGFIIDNENYQYPFDEVESLYKLFNKNIALSISNDICSLIGINNVVFESLNLIEQTHENVQAYELSLISDDDFDVIVK